MRLVMRVAMRTAEEEVVGARLAGLHGGVARVDFPAPTMRCGAKRFDRVPQVAEARADMHAVGFQRGRRCACRRR